ncbi:MAG: hypothetical protein ACQ9MH_10655 [Nitrospinales bacterium]
MRQLNLIKINCSEKLVTVSNDIKKRSEELEEINLHSAGQDEIEQMEECLNQLEDDLCAGDKILNEIWEITQQTGKQLESLDFDADVQTYNFENETILNQM